MSEEKTKLGLSGEDMKGALEHDDRPAFDPRMLMKLMGDDRFDVDAFMTSPDYADNNERMMAMMRGDDTPAAKEYWESCGKGLRKELHNGDDPLEKWASYIPLAAETDPSRRFPLIFVLHGAHNPILMTEGYGMTQLAAEKECIVIVPQNENEDSILKLYEYAKENYPVDLTRVYMCGYSFGGFMTSRNMWLHPEIFAGVGWGGMLFATAVDGHTMDDQWYPAFSITEEMIANVEKLEMPVLLFMGENEMLCLEPLWRDQEHKEADHVIPLDSSDKHAAFNNLRRAGGCRPEDFKDRSFYETHEDPVVRSVGAEFDRTEVIEDRGRHYFIGDSLNSKGENLFRTVSCEGMNHSATRMWAPLIWEHISRFARNVKTGELIRL